MLKHVCAPSVGAKALLVRASPEAPRSNAVAWPIPSDLWRRVVEWDENVLDIVDPIFWFPVRALVTDVTRPRSKTTHQYPMMDVSRRADVVRMERGDDPAIARTCCDERA